MSSRSREKIPKIITPLAAGIGGAAVGSYLRGRKTRKSYGVAERFISAANARADNAEAGRQEAEKRTKEAQEESGIDPLTGLYNRRGFENAYNELVGRPNLEKGQHSLIALDLDKFKEINDGEGGHAAGDAVLRSVAGILKTVSRPGDSVARIGGDEMVLMLSRADATVAETVAQRARTAIEATGQVTASFGIAEIDPFLDMGENLRFADQALYGAKHNGRNEVEIYSASVS